MKRMKKEINELKKKLAEVRRVHLPFRCVAHTHARTKAPACCAHTCQCAHAPSHVLTSMHTHKRTMHEIANTRTHTHACTHKYERKHTHTHTHTHTHA